MVINAIEGNNLYKEETIGAVLMMRIRICDFLNIGNKTQGLLCRKALISASMATSHSGCLAVG